MINFFFNSLFDYKTIDSVIANEALRRFGNHMWYLTEKLVPLCFFSNNVKHSTKLAMAKKLLNFEKNECFYNRLGSGFGKPKFPKLNDDFSRDLNFYVGNDSWMFFKILKLDSSFLQQPINTWKKIQLLSMPN